MTVYRRLQVGALFPDIFCVRRVPRRKLGRRFTVGCEFQATDRQICAYKDVRILDFSKFYKKSNEPQSTYPVLERVIRKLFQLDGIGPGL